METNQELELATRTGLEPVPRQPVSGQCNGLAENSRESRKDEGQRTDTKEQLLVRKLVRPDLLALVAADPERITDHLANHVLGPRGCWEYQGSRSEKGYGRMRFTEYAAPVWLHRLSLAFFYGIDPCEFLVRHRCDNPTCVNPDHLEPGTHADNMRDVSRRYWERKWPKIAAKLGPEYGYGPKPTAKQLGLSPIEAMAFRADNRRRAWLRVLRTARRYARRRAAK